MAFIHCTNLVLSHLYAIIHNDSQSLICSKEDQVEKGTEESELQNLAASFIVIIDTIIRNVHMGAPHITKDHDTIHRQFPPDKENAPMNGQKIKMKLAAGFMKCLLLLLLLIVLTTMLNIYIEL